MPYAWSWPKWRAPNRSQDEIGKLNDSPNKCVFSLFWNDSTFSACNLLHNVSNEIFIFFLSFIAIFDGLQGVGSKTGVRSFRIYSSNMLLFYSTNHAASRRVSTLPFWAYNNLLYIALLRWPSIAQLYDCPFLFTNIFLYEIS